MIFLSFHQEDMEKTSLVLKVLNNININYKEIDLYTARESNEIGKNIIQGIFELIKSITPKHEQILSLIKKYFSKIKLKIVLGPSGLNIELEENSSDSAFNILEALIGLDKILCKKQTTAVLFIDEFQQVGKLRNSTPIEGAIRHIAQKTDNIIFIFSGSNRHILCSMIDDKSKPLYKLCNRLNLERMSKSHNIKHISKASTELWGSPLSATVIETIINLTELHPYYINALCNNLYIRHSDKHPTTDDVYDTWNEYIFQEKSNTAKELDALNHSQYAILKFIATGNNKMLTGKAALGKLNLSSNAVRESIKKLEEKDFIFKNASCEYIILDPLIKVSIVFFTG